MRRKLLPALWRLSSREQVAGKIFILGVAREPMDDAAYRSWAKEVLAAEADGSILDGWLRTAVYYHTLRGAQRADYRVLRERIQALEHETGAEGRRIFYLALPRSVFPSAIEGLGQAGLNRAKHWTRLVIEKPFGHDLESATKLNALIHRYFLEEQVYRIDHYLGKETVQNLLVFRFANPIFESVWHRDRVERVEIGVAEQIGVEGRDRLLRSGRRAQGHGPKPPHAVVDACCHGDPGHLRRRCHSSGEDQGVAVGRPGPARGGDPRAVRSGPYRRGSGACLPRGSRGSSWHPDRDLCRTPPVHRQLALAGRSFPPLWTGKRLARRLTQIRITFRCPPVSVFQPFDRCDIHSNQLIITLQPDEGFDLAFEVKAPTEPFTLDTQELRFRYAEAYGPLPEAYVSLLRDVMLGDATLFVRADEVEAAWRLYAPVLGRVDNSL